MREQKGQAVSLPASRTDIHVRLRRFYVKNGVWRMLYSNSNWLTIELSFGDDVPEWQHYNQVVLLVSIVC